MWKGTRNGSTNILEHRPGCARIPSGCQITLSETRRQARNFIIVWSQQDLKSRTIVVIGGVDAIECEHVDMEVEPQGRVEALDERHRAALRFPLGAKFAVAADQGSEYCPGEDGENIGHQ
jgi:hypothetical protein